MTQPFRGGATVYRSPLWPELDILYAPDRILIGADRSYRTLGNAPFRGGCGDGRRFVNWKVPLDYDCSDPEKAMRERLTEWGYDVDSTVGLQTAAHLTHASFEEEAGDAFRLLVCATAGTGNAARAGLGRETFSAYAPGTVNVIVLIDGRLTDAAMANAIVSATEAKCAAFADLDVRDRDYADRVATGTTTDAVLIAVSRSDAYAQIHRYAGAATTLGNAIGRLVYRTVSEAAGTQGEP
ncbi:adenosylcobinamide amidohydrolase [Paenibacillaceae bacterium WGS1546]|uniref:adenosylcobinamide amidohydrolase n=1 Tax=Cohnella sp. WGS1546 TaxID=3366810 RepID=UPI00372CF2A2